MLKHITIGYQHRQGKWKDTILPKILLANHFLENISGFSSGDKVQVQYLSGQVIITKLNN